MVLVDDIGGHIVPGILDQIGQGVHGRGILKQGFPQVAEVDQYAAPGIPAVAREALQVFQVAGAEGGGVIPVPCPQKLGLEVGGAGVDGIALAIGGGDIPDDLVQAPAAAQLFQYVIEALAHVAAVIGAAARGVACAGYMLGSQLHQVYRGQIARGIGVAGIGGAAVNIVLPGQLFVVCDDLLRGEAGAVLI